MNDEQPTDFRALEVPPTVKVGQREFALVLPKSLQLRYDLVEGFATNRERASFACLAACWSGMGRPKAKYEDSYNVLRWGGDVADELFERGVPRDEAAIAASWAFVKVGQSLPELQRLEAAEKNSEALG